MSKHVVGNAYNAWRDVDDVVRILEQNAKFSEDRVRDAEKKYYEAVVADIQVPAVYLESLHHSMNGAIAKKTSDEKIHFEAKKVADAMYAEYLALSLAAK